MIQTGPCAAFTVRCKGIMCDVGSPCSRITEITYCSSGTTRLSEVSNHIKNAWLNSNCKRTLYTNKQIRSLSLPRTYVCDLNMIFVTCCGTLCFCRIPHIYKPERPRGRLSIPVIKTPWEVRHRNVWEYLLYKKQPLVTLTALLLSSTYKYPTTSLPHRCCGDGVLLAQTWRSLVKDLH